MGRLEPPHFRTEEVAIGAAAMVMLLGELDLQSEKQVVAGFERALNRHPEALAADLRGLTFMDSTGVHALINAERHCRRQGTRFFIIRGCLAVDRVLSVLGLDRLFEIIAAPEQIPGAAAAA
ncbi:MAG TPA: STAS domain-containing protein [Solirubrobacteraceae bacterium]|nr:STAS domain-containing protein [Solirubrobacteraceae bacterium]